VQTRKACIVSMDYKIKNKDETPDLQPLNESERDCEKVKELLEITLGWDKEDVKTFNDKSIHLMNLSDKIDNHIKELKITARQTAK
jgi:hypothetical protein